MNINVSFQTTVVIKWYARILLSKNYSFRSLLFLHHKHRHFPGRVRHKFGKSRWLKLRSPILLLFKLHNSPSRTLITFGRTLMLSTAIPKWKTGRIQLNTILTLNVTSESPNFSWTISFDKVSTVATVYHRICQITVSPTGVW